FLELRSGKTLGVDQGLLAFVVAGRMMQIGFADLDVITEDGVELYLERGNAGTLPLALFDLSDVLLGVAAETAQLVQLAVDSRLDYAAVTQRKRRFGDDGLLDPLTQIGELVQ